MKERARTLINNYWHYAALALLAVWMVATRIQGYEKLIVDGTPLFVGTDPWYQYRSVLYTVQHFPSTIPYEVWSGYPTGTQQGQFGTLYDQLVAAISIVLNGGSPTPTEVRYVMLFISPVLGMLTLFPVYYLGKYITDNKLGGVLSGIFIALISGQFYTKTRVGFAEHNAFEPALIGLAFASVVWLLAAEQNDTSVALDTSWTARKKRLLLRTSIAGLGISLLPLVWPVGIFVYVIFMLIILVYGGAVIPRMNRRPERVLLPIGLAHVVPTILLTLSFTTWTVTLNVFGPLQVLVPLLASTYALVGIAFEYKRRKKDVPWYSFSILSFATLALLTIAVFIVATEQVLNGIEKLIFISSIVAEGQPLSIFRMFQSYGVLLPIALLLLIDMLTVGVYEEDDALFAFGTSLTVLTLLTFIQVRFNYYLVVLLAPAAAYSIKKTIQSFRLNVDFPEYDKTQLFIAVSILLTVSLSLVGPFAAPVYTESPDSSRYEAWEPTVKWLETNTPKEGQLGAPENDPLNYNGTYSPTDDYQYPNGTYGVLTKWSAGHYITVIGQRIPVTNPFQDHLRVGAEYMLAQNENTSLTTLDRRLNAEGDVRYVVVSWDNTAPQASHFRAQAQVREGVTPETFSTPFGQSENQILPDTRQRLSFKSQAYYNTTVVRLYHYHGSRIPESNTLVHGTIQDGRFIPSERDSLVTRAISPEQADRIAANNTSLYNGGIGRHAPEPVPAMEHHRLVYASSEHANENPLYTLLDNHRAETTSLKQSDFNKYPRFLKVFEQVEGATISGTARPNTTVNATVTLQMQTGETFQYTQHAQTNKNGKFTMTVPYSTTGYDNWGPENGYTNVSTRATGPYTLTTENCQTTLSVTEGSVIGEKPDPERVNVCSEN